MEEKQKLTNGFKSHKNMSSSEKKCNRCGRVTVSLHALYSHQRKCKGTILGSMTCCHCKRKFSRLLLYRQHKETCLKSLWKRKVLRKNFIKKRLKSIGITGKAKGNGNQRKTPPKPSTIVCPNCMKLFSSKSEYDAHERKGSCSGSSSARKSFPNVAKKPMPKVSHKEVSGHLSKEKIASIHLSDEVEISDSESGVSCTWCKNVYPNKEILAKHLERNSRCAMAHHKQKSQGSSISMERSARKSIQNNTRKSMQGNTRKSMQDNTRNARKSLPNSKHSSPRFGPQSPRFDARSPRFNAISPRFDSRSARKSLPNSSQKRFSVDPSPLKSLNQCPVCYQKIPDPFKFFQHQKKLNHWGRATKSMNNICKCPFCSKQFMHVRSFNAHVRNHSDKTQKEIDYFLKKTTCSICAQIFASETAKYQHMRYFHSKPTSDNSLKNLDSSSYSLLPLVIKQKLRLHPNTCPICAKEFPATYFRNRHFQENHLDAELECKFCPRKFNTVESMENHMHDCHYDDFQFECLVCKINLATAPHVVLHCTKVHSNQDPKKIIRSREDKSLVDAPGFEYPTASQSIEVDDEGKNGFYCDICDVSFLKKASLQNHRQTKLHKDTLVKNLDTMRESIAELPSPKRVPKVTKKTPEILTCNECLEDFSSVKDFVPHRLSHFGRGKYLRISELNLYTCEICGEVCNSHSKVQMHLFWHLQVESTTTEKSSARDKGKTDPIVPDRLSGQQVAKKSFNKSSDSQQQEIVIGGVKKSLFTCENCNIGFTTQAHYSLHVRKLCKKKISAEKPKDRDTSLAGSSRMIIGQAIVEKRNIKYCSMCNTLYNFSVKEAHKELCEKCTRDTSEGKKNATEHIKSDMVRKNVVAACVACNELFGNPKAYTEHMLACHTTLQDLDSDEEEGDETSEEFKNTILCTTCNCLFLSSLVQENHETFCKNASYHNFDAESTKEILKPFTQLKGAIAICISCSVVFNNIRILKKHFLQHKAKKEAKKNSSLNGPKSIDEIVLSEDEPLAMSDSLDGTSAQKSLDVSSSVSNDSMVTDPNTSIATDHNDVSMVTHHNASFDQQSMLASAQDESTSEDPFSILRENFSQLFCILINDADLMQQLGFGEEPVDDVLINVLQQMGQSPVGNDDENSDIERFRKNIRIFLDFCLKDQVMELIESGKTSVDDIVVEALKTFTSEESNTSKEME